MATWPLGDWKVVRVPDPGFELVLPQDGPTVELLTRSPWLQPLFATDDWALRVGSAALLLQGNGTNVVVDPWLAFDDPERFEPRLGALADAGCAADDVDVVVNSHVDGIGGNVVPATGEPAFPNARYLVPAAEIEAVRDGQRGGAEALLGLLSSGRLEPVTSGSPVVPGLDLVALPGHNAAHLGVVVGSPPRAVIAGHLFLHPAQIANPDNADLDEQPDVVRATRRELLDRCERDDLVLIGPLFAEPGGGRVRRGPSGWCLEPFG